MLKHRVATCFMLLAVWACDPRKPLDPVPNQTTPKYGNHGGGGTVPETADVQLTDLVRSSLSCMGDDAVRSGLVSGVKSVEDLNCNSTDISVSQALITAYSLDGVVFVALSPTSPIRCTLGQPLFVQMTLLLGKQQNSKRTDVGLWISYDGSDARSGLCSHYSLSPTFGGQGVFNLDSDQCGDMALGADTFLPVGLIELQCRDNGDGLLKVGTCIGWKQPGTDTVCPATNSPDGLRLGTLPGNKSHCNCQTIPVPVIIESDPLGKS